MNKFVNTAPKNQDTIPPVYKRVVDEVKLNELPTEKILERLKKAKDKITEKRARYEQIQKQNELRLKSYTIYCIELERVSKAIISKRPNQK